MKDFHQKLLATFQIEHRDHVEQIRSLLAMIESTGAAAAGPEMEEVFRRAHSLKGAARAVDLRPIEGLAHRLETLFSRVRKGEFVLTKDVTEVVQRVLDASEDCLAALGGDRPAAGIDEALLAIERILGIESKTVEEPPAEAAAPAFQPVETVRITAQNFDGLFRSAGGLVAESQHQDQVTETLDGLARDIAVIEKEGERVRRAAVAVRSHPEISPDVSRMMSLLDSMEFNVRSLSRRVSAARRLQRRSVWSLRQLGDQLQRDIWQARMVPAEGLLEGYRKMMRDLARDEGKEIDFRAISANVNADRQVLEALKDPIMHLLRNAVSHGIETPAERNRKGKGPAGVVTLRVDANGQRLTIAIQDDGRGVDLSRVAEVAVREGILSESSAAHSAPQELMRMLFRPGFSTAPTVTSLSGRGMGLSVVYEAVRRLQGDLDIQPAAGGGTALLISVPLSIATHKLLLVNSGGTMFAIPVFGVERLLRIERSAVQTMEAQPVITFNGHPVTLSTIHGLLGLEQPFAGGSDRLQILVLRSGGRSVAVLVDDVVREMEAVIQDLGPASGCGGKVSSGVVADDGSIAFVVNPMELVQSSAQARWNVQPLTLAKPSQPRPLPAPSSILVVDDSMTTRTLEKSILEAQGYRVRIAVDGVEALARLHDEKPDLVIADIEMPRLNGFGLIKAMKKNPRFEKIPVIIVSSVERREDQERGLALGADAYIVKQKFDQDELLAAIRQIL